MTAIRVQTPVHTDAWMRGDRYGTIVRIYPKRIKGNQERAVAIVRCDRSNKERRFWDDELQYI